jgi:hypothetical protein
MVRLTQLADDGTELAAVEVDDFTIEILYSGIADLLQRASAVPEDVAPPAPISHEARERRSRILTRIFD